jgi:hypothetical protein
MPIHTHAAGSHGNASLQSHRQVYWLWDGLIAFEAVTLLSAPPKTGKTTLLSLLLDRRREGGHLLGRTVEPGRTILCSEENGRLWALRQPPLNFGDQLKYHEPPDETPTLAGWVRFIDDLLALDPDVYDLLVIDTAMTFLPTARNHPATLRQALDDLRLVAGNPAGVLLLHQTRAVRNGSRPHGPLAAFADILIDMRIPPLSPRGRAAGGKGPSRRREFHGVGRYPGTLQHVAAELNAEGTDYIVLPDDSPEPPALAPTLETLRRLLSESPTPLTRQEILARWPETEPPPRADSLWRTLTRSCELGMFVRSGAGTKGEAFRYGVDKQ